MKKEANSQLNREWGSSPLGKAVFFVSLGIAYFLLNIGFIYVTLLKESGEFWQHSGGYPVAVRDTVRMFYYPLLAMLFLFQGLTTIALLKCCLRRLSVTGICGMLALLPAWILTFTGIGILTANNLDNLVEDRPLHWHQGDP